jgi:hypothetical protein
VSLPSGWQLKDAATALSTLMLDVADRYGWARRDFLQAVSVDFEETLAYSPSVDKSRPADTGT